MNVAGYVIHLERTEARRANVQEIIDSCPVPASIQRASDGRSLSSDEIAGFYCGGIHDPRYPFELRNGEVATFMSHRACWRRMLDERLDAAHEMPESGVGFGAGHAGRESAQPWTGASGPRTPISPSNSWLSSRLSQSGYCNQDINLPYICAIAYVGSHCRMPALTSITLDVDLPTSVTAYAPAVAQDFSPNKRYGYLSNWNTDSSQSLYQFNRANPITTPATLAVRVLGTIEAYGWQIETRLESLADNISAYDDRISILEEQAAIDEIFLNSGSKETFQRFVRTNPLIRLGHLFLLENGNLRAVWKGKNSSHIGLQFLDSGYIQYVLFKQRRAGDPVSRAFGRDTPTGLRRQIDALELLEVLSA